jgi:Flp pilus assembly protein TadD
MDRAGPGSLTVSLPAVPRRLASALLLLGSLACGNGAPEPDGRGPTGQGGESGTIPKARALARELHGAARAIEERRFEEGRALAQAHLAAHPEDGQAMFLLGLGHYWTENYGAARPWLEQALAREPGLNAAHDLLGHSLFMLGELEGARREYEALLAVAPREPKAHYGLGLIELEETALESAEQRFQRALELLEELGKSDPRQRAARQGEVADGHARLGEVHLARGDYEAARDELLTATTLSAGNVSALYTLGLAYRRLGEERLADEAAARYAAARQALLARQGKE